jgi:hypothetical protein
VGTAVRRRRTHAFRQAPWRLQVRSTGRTALGVICLLVIGALYLGVSARVARAGRQVLVLEARREELQRTHAELTARRAELLNPMVMWKRAGALDFRPAGPDDLVYVTVPGYVAPDPFIAPRPKSSNPGSQGMLSPAYTETLGEWFMRWLSDGGG